MRRGVGPLLCLALALIQGGCAVAPRAPVPDAEAPAARRIVSLAPSATELLFALGAGGQVVACTRACNYPPEIRDLPRVGDVHIDLERLVAVAPDLVVAEWLTSPDTVRRMQSLELRVLRVDSSTLEGYFDTLAKIGDATGCRPRAAELAASLRARLADMRRRRAARPPAARPRVFVEIWSRPLQTAAGGTFIDEMVTLAGGTNVFGELEQYPQVSPEALITRDPDVILLTTSSPAEFSAQPAFRTLRAVREGHVYPVDPDTLVRPGPRLDKALDELARDLSP